jgi:hypothetical protein
MHFQFAQGEFRVIHAILHLAYTKSRTISTLLTGAALILIWPHPWNFLKAVNGEKGKDILPPESNTINALKIRLTMRQVKNLRGTGDCGQVISDK